MGSSAIMRMGVIIAWTRTRTGTHKADIDETFGDELDNFDLATSAARKDNLSQGGAPVKTMQPLATVRSGARE